MTQRHMAALSVGSWSTSAAAIGRGGATRGQASFSWRSRSFVSEAQGAPAGGAELEAGRCYQFSVITNQFQIASYTLVW